MFVSIKRRLTAIVAIDFAAAERGLCGSVWNAKLAEIQTFGSLHRILQSICFEGDNDTMEAGLNICGEPNSQGLLRADFGDGLNSNHLLDLRWNG